MGVFQGNFGCIADDFTGASDAASFLAKGGLRTVLLNGVPEEAAPGEYDALVVALKSRTQPLAEALEETRRAAAFLERQGVEQFFFKYCSTFDSTPKGNIGPVADMLMERLGAPFTVLCPALPVNGRTVREGRLYVNGVPLEESPMKDHPLTPMWDSDLARLMAPQSRYPCLKLNGASLKRPKAKILEAIEEFGAGKPHFYVIPDFQEQGDAQRLTELFGDLRLLTGGSGLMEGLAGRRSAGLEIPKNAVGGVPGRALLLAGSCSEATLRQVACYRRAGGFSYHLDPLRLLKGGREAEAAWGEIASREGPALVYSSDRPEAVRAAQEAGGARVSALLEDAMSRLAARAVEAGFGRIIVAGGETSGAVTRRLGYRAYAIGASVAPGVPVMAPLANDALRIVLKSGNFGQPDFFQRALELTGR